MKVACRLVLSLMFVLISSQAYAISFTVNSMANSTGGGVGLNTGISFTIGDYFEVAVDPNDLWSAGPLPRWSNADGLDGYLYATGTDESGEASGTLIGQDFGLLGLYHYGSLVGEIGGQYFKIGTSFKGVAPATGNLLLYYWDSNNYDNSGAVAANIDVNVNGVPEPTTLFLLGTGMVGLAGASLRKKTKH